MGARVSIAFQKGDEKSVALFSHWGGDEFPAFASEYAKELKSERTSMTMPLDRFEPNTVMVDFIRYLTKNESRIEGGYYLGVDENDGDNSDYGHHVIEL